MVVSDRQLASAYWQGPDKLVPMNANGKLDRDALAAVWQWQQRGA